MLVYRSKCSLTDRYRLHLSAADLLFVLALPFWAVDSALADWRFGAATCVGVHVIYTVNLYGSVLILAFISLDRYLAVVRATDTNTGGLRQLLAHRLVYVGECPTVSFIFCGSPLFLFYSHSSLSHLISSPSRCLVACWPAGSARLDIRPNPRRWRGGDFVSTILPREQRSSLGGCVPPPDGPGGAGDPRPGSTGVLLRDRHQADSRPTGGPEAETQSSQDHRGISALLLLVLAPLWSGHHRGCPNAPGGPAQFVHSGSWAGHVAGSG